MKKDFLNVVVILFITIAFMLVIYDITAPESFEYDQTAETTQIITPANEDMVSTDIEVRD